MSSVGHHLARRAMESYPALQDNQIPGWKGSILVVTVCVAVLSLYMIGYGYEQVVATLIMAESPPSEQKDDPVKEPLLNEKLPNFEAEQPRSEPEPLSLRMFQTPRQLRARAGRGAAFRGLGLYVLCNFFYSGIQRVMNSNIPNYFDLMPHVAVIVAATAVATMSLTWNHIVISESPYKWWGKRLPGRAAFKTVLLPTILYGLANEFMGLLITDVVRSFRMITINDDLSENWVQVEKALPRILGTYVSFLIVLVLIGTPCRIVLARVQASLLPEDVQSIVSLDRSFGGKIDPNSVDWTGITAVKNAFLSVDGRIIRRVLKVYVKAFFLQIAAVVFFGAIYAAEVILLLGGIKPKNVQAQP